MSPLKNTNTNRLVAEDEVIWITGASSGIGRAVALQLADLGYRVVISALPSDRLTLTANQHKNFVAVPLDVTDTAATASVLQRIQKEYGPIGLAILNAGGSNKNKQGSVAYADLQPTVDLNLNGVLRPLEHLVPPMQARKRGHIALMGSIVSYRGLPVALAYCASKAAVRSVAETLRCDLAADGIKVQLITPGFVKTPLTYKNIFPMPFMVTPERAARSIVNGLHRSVFEIAFPRRMIMLMRLLRALPYGLYFPLMRFLLRFSLQAQLNQMRVKL